MRIDMNLRLNILLILLTLGLSAWTYYLYHDQTQDDLSGLVKRADTAEYVGQGTNAMVYDLNGSPQYSASAVEIKRFEKEDRTVFSSPTVEIFNVENGLKQWTLQADKAEITREKLLHLVGNVVLQSLDQTTQLQRIETDSLEVDLNTQDIFSESQVKSQGLGFITTGTGLKGNLKQQIATLSKDVKTYLEPTIIQQPIKQSIPKKN